MDLLKHLQVRKKRRRRKRKRRKKRSKFIIQSINTENNSYSFLWIPLTSTLTQLTQTSGAGQIQHSPYSLVYPDSHQQPPPASHQYYHLTVHCIKWLVAAARLATQLLLSSTDSFYTFNQLLR